MQLYLYDLSEYDGRDVDAHGEYPYKYLDHYWTDSDRQAYLFFANDRIAGFALIRTKPVNSVAEFFVMRHYRRHGIGRAAVTELIPRFAGQWEIKQLATNRPAIDFWRRAIPYSYHEGSDGEDFFQRFTVP